MSLATRCTACSTVFRVVQDQLKVSEGWVRCGRCNEVFNALEGLFDLDRDAPTDWSPPSVFMTPVEFEAGGGGSLQEPFDIDLGELAAEGPSPSTSTSTSASYKNEAPQREPRRHQASSTPAARVSERDRLDFPDAKYDSDLLEDDPEDAQSMVGPLWPAEVSAGPTTSTAAPEFLQRAQRQARWHTPTMRATLAVAAVLLGIVFVLQAALHFRDTIAARWAATKPMLVALCDIASCTVEAPRRIDDVSVESTALTRAADPADSFKLAVSLRNHGPLTVALPSVDLNLTDANGVLVARRVLTPRDFRATSTLMAPGADSAMQLLLTADNPRVTGYTVEIFYP